MKKKITPFGGYILLQSEIKCHAKNRKWQKTQQKKQGGRMFNNKNEGSMLMFAKIEFTLK